LRCRHHVEIVERKTGTVSGDEPLAQGRLAGLSRSAEHHDRCLAEVDRQWFGGGSRERMIRHQVRDYHALSM